MTEKEFDERFPEAKTDPLLERLRSSLTSYDMMALVAERLAMTEGDVRADERAKTIEECARVAEQNADIFEGYAEHIARDIRELK